MGYDKVKIKQIMGLMVLAAVLVLFLVYSKVIFGAVVMVIQILMPFIVGGVIAFILNLPMKVIENRLLGRWKGKVAGKLKRPVSMILSVIFVALIIFLVCITVIPQLTQTIIVLGEKIPPFVDKIIDSLEQLSVQYPQIQEEVEKLGELEVDWKKLGENVLSFLQNGVGSVVTSTFSVATSIIGGVVNFVISFIFSFYILSQKERLQNQALRILRAYLSEKICRRTEHVFSLLYNNFSKFITGQCLEAVILGAMFIVVMCILRMPYAMMVGVLVAFTALIPIVGAFIGCAIGTFLILIENPMQALVFLILFLVLQQIEGNVIYPRVVGNSVGLPSMWVLLAVSVGGSLLGVPGMLTFIPVFSTAYVLLKESVNGRNERCKQTKSGERTQAGGQTKPSGQTAVVTAQTQQIKYTNMQKKRKR